MFLGKTLLGLIVVIVFVVGYCITSRCRRKHTPTGYNDLAPVSPEIATNARCPICGNPQPPGSKFCEQCGTQLPLRVAPTICPRCSSQVTPGERFCGQCGTSLMPSR